MAVIRGEKTINQWRRELLQGAAQIFEPGDKKRIDKGEQEILLQQLYAKVGELTVERDFLSRTLKG